MNLILSYDIPFYTLGVGAAMGDLLYKLKGQEKTSINSELTEGSIIYIYSQKIFSIFSKKKKKISSRTHIFFCSKCSVHFIRSKY